MAIVILRWYLTQSFPRSACKQAPQYVPASFDAGIFFYSRASSERVVRNQYGASVSCKMIRYETS